MRINEALLEVESESHADGEVVERERRRVPGGRAVDRWNAARNPILPFFSVLLTGRDGGWASLRGHEGGALPEHPSVRYVRVIYLAVALNWVIDVLGIGYLFHTYVTGWSDAWIQWGVPGLLAVVLSSGFAAFAVSLVCKPLAKPRALSLPRWGLAVCVGMASVCLLLVVASTVFEMKEAPVLAFLVRIACVGLAVGGFASLVVWFGVMDALYVTSRGAVMVVVGYLVASPLHEAMFQREVEDAFYGRRVADLRGRLGELESAAALASKEAREQCLERRAVAEVVAKECLVEERELEAASLIAAASDLVASDEANGKFDEKNRDELIARASKLGVSEAMTILMTRPGKNGYGRLAIKYEARAKEAAARRDALGEKLTVCRQENAHTTTERRDIYATCEQEANRDEELAADREPLEAELELYEQRIVPLGALARTLELERIVEGAGGNGQAGSSGSAENARNAMRFKLMAAWVLALVMPLMVLTMKVTGGERLEPYLHERWKEKHDDRR